MPAKNLYKKDEKGIYFHVYNKGIEKRNIFNDEKDYEVFGGFLKDYLTAPADPKSIKRTFTVNGHVFQGTPHLPKNYFNKIELIAYSLTPSRFYLLLHQKTRGALEGLIRSLGTRYSMYFNKKYKHTGALFEGPYKSIQVKDKAGLLLLTRSLHRADDHSSYAEYIGTRETEWVKPNVVLSFFSKGTSDYKDFVEKHELDQKEKERLEGIAFENEPEYLERRDLKSSVENNPQGTPVISSKEIYLDPYLNPLKRTPEILMTAVVFSLLLTIGLRDVAASTHKNSNPTPTPSVLSTTKETEETKPKVLLTVTMTDRSGTVNIRQKPTIDSKKIGEAKNGDIFEFVSLDSEWYGVKLIDGSTGFISTAYIK